MTHTYIDHIKLKLRYSEKATKFWKNLPLLFDISKVISKKVWTFFQILWSSQNGGTLSISELYENQIWLQREVFGLFFLSRKSTTAAHNLKPIVLENWIGIFSLHNKAQLLLLDQRLRFKKISCNTVSLPYFLMQIPRRYWLHWATFADLKFHG